MCWNYLKRTLDLVMIVQLCKYNKKQLFTLNGCIVWFVNFMIPQNKAVKKQTKHEKIRYSMPIIFTHVLVDSENSFYD